MSHPMQDMSSDGAQSFDVAQSDAVPDDGSAAASSKGQHEQIASAGCSDMDMDS
jgi:hypothetical protein